MTRYSSNNFVQELEENMKNVDDVGTSIFYFIEDLFILILDFLWLGKFDILWRNISIVVSYPNV